MNWWEPLVPLVFAIVGALVGGLIVHRLTLRREPLAVRRTQRVSFLLDAYRKLIDASERDALSSMRRDNLEAALADKMLLGGPREIEATARFQIDFVEGKSASLVPLIEALRSSLREELDLPRVDLPKRLNLRLQSREVFTPHGCGAETQQRIPERCSEMASEATRVTGCRYWLWWQSVARGTRVGDLSSASRSPIPAKAQTVSRGT